MGAITGLTRLGTRGIRGARGVGCDGEDIVAGEKSDGGQDDWTGKWESRMTTAGQENGNNRTTATGQNDRIKRRSKIDMAKRKHLHLTIPLELFCSF